MRRLNSQTLILIGTTAFVLYLAGVPLLMLLDDSIRSAPVGEPGATLTFRTASRPISIGISTFLNSLYYVLGPCLLTFLIGTFLAWVGERTNTPRRSYCGIRTVKEIICRA